VVQERKEAEIQNGPGVVIVVENENREVEVEEVQVIKEKPIKSEEQTAVNN
jgi:hypothetical protein